ncbi:MAG TPA: glutaredoxin [Polyangiaceae bacterium]|nr:glutaredoxin [Polyangiaceae bacterium]
MARDSEKSILSRAGGKLVKVLERVDTLGGRLRDVVASRLASSMEATPKSDVSGVPAKPVVRPAPDSEGSSGLGDPQRAVQIFGRRSCMWSARAVSVVKSAELEHAYVELGGFGSDPLANELKAATGQTTVPYVFVRGQFVGGFNALDELHRLGQLEYLALPQHERVKHPLHGRIEVVQRSRDAERVPGE